MTDIVNLQRKVKLDTALLRSFAQGLSSELEEVHGRHFSVAFISDARMKQLNQLFRNIDTTTDVLSFPHEADAFEPDQLNLGDIVISAEQAQKQAVENGLPFEIELKQLILHGLLHLCGMDHENDSGEMNARELALRGQLGI